MNLLLSNYYKPKKTVLIYLETDEDIQRLATELKSENKALFITEGREAIKIAWSKENYLYVIWTYLTNQDDRWCVIVLDKANKTANIHTSSLAEQAKKEKAEIVGFLTTLSGLTNATTPSLDLDTKDRTARESGFNAILYIRKLLERIKKSKEITNIDADGFGDVKDNKGKSKLQEVEEKFEALEREINKLSSLKSLEVELKTLREHKCPTTSTTPPITTTPFTFQNKTVDQIKGEIEKLLKDTQTKWNDYLKQTNSTNINIRMFQSFKETAQEILPLIKNALESKKELTDYQLLDKEWGKKKPDYDNSRDYLNAWYTLRLFLHEWEELNKKPLQNSMTDKEKQKLSEFDKIKLEKEKKDKELTQLVRQNELLKTQTQEKHDEVKKLNSRLEQWKSFKTESRSNLTEEVRKKIIEAYNAEDYLIGMYREVMKNLLIWEYSGTEEQKETIKTLKTEINKCINFLEKVQTQINY